jgi:4-hydroxythreonine-4-phosphate dehydrogenase
MSAHLPRIAVTVGDVSGIGPEVVVRALADPRVGEWCRPLVIGHADIVARAASLVGVPLRLERVDAFLASQRDPSAIPCINPAGDDGIHAPPGVVDPRAGAAAFEYLAAAAGAARRGEVDAIVTAPLSKLALHQAGHDYPGQTEILAEACGVADFAMMLYLPAGDRVASPCGLGVAHATLHTSIASVPGLLSHAAVKKTIGLVNTFMRRVGCETPRVGVCALNPHAGEQGLFGDEERRVIAPAVQQAVVRGVRASGPFPADTLLKRAVAGEFDGVVAMYHDQGHIALKLIGAGRAVNVTLGLPIVRTSPSHGTAFDIAWQGRADPTGMLEAIRVAALLAAQQT